MEIRKTNQNDLEDILKVYETARHFMFKNGNPNQWGSSYPEEKIIQTDVDNEQLFSCVDATRLLGCFAFIEGDDPTYNEIVNGRWLDDNPYAVIHRMAVIEYGKGIGSICIDWCFSQYRNIRVDTHKDNIPMQRLLSKKGFKYCGVIYNNWGDERLAFQRA